MLRLPHSGRTSVSLPTLLPFLRPSASALRRPSLPFLTSTLPSSSLSTSSASSRRLSPSRPSSPRLRLWMSSLAAVSGGTIGILNMETAAAVGEKEVKVERVRNAVEEAASSSAATAATSSSSFSSSSFIAPEPTFWQKMREIWIPTNAQQLYEAEKKTFETILYPYESRMVDITPDEIVAGKEKDIKWQINTLTLTNPHLAKQEAETASGASAPLVLLHGFGAGIGMWLSNYNHLAATFSRVDCVDMLGWGRSTRADFKGIMEKKIKRAKLKKKGDNDEAYTKAVATFAEDFTVDSLERWRIAMGHEKMILVGHSMGGYLASAYALKYPHRVENLILASPIGVPHRKELSVKSWSWSARQLIGFARWAWWSMDGSPQSIVRGLGRYGKTPVTGYVTNRFASNENAEVRAAEMEKREAAPRFDREVYDKSPLSSSSSDPAVGEESAHRSGPSQSTDMEWDDSLNAARKLEAQVHAAAPYFDKPIVADYLYHICAQEGSGEFAFARLFDTSGFAHKPLIASLPSISCPNNASSSAAAAVSAASDLVPITFFYGSHDWMDVSAGIETTRIIQERGGRAQCVEIPKAGHQLMIDNPLGFIQKLKQAVEFGKRRE